MDFSTTYLLTIGDVAKILQLSASSVRSLCDSGQIGSVRPMGPNGHRRITRQSLERYLQSLSPKFSQADEPEATRMTPGPTLDETLSSIRRLARSGRVSQN